jgi:ankyrin repeat protein
MNTEIYKDIVLSEFEYYAINNELDKIKLLDLDLLCEDDLVKKLFFRACEQNHIEIVKYLLPYIEDYTHGFYICLYFEHLTIASLMMENFTKITEQIQEMIINYQLLEILFGMNKCNSIEYLLNIMPEFVCDISCSKIDSLSGYPFLVGVKQNKFATVKVFLDYFIKKNDKKNIKYICGLQNHHAFYTACKNNYIDMSKYFCDIVSFYNITIENDIITKYNVDFNKYEEL